MSDTLLLNADFQPISILPLSVCDWQQSVKLLWLNKIEVVTEYENWEIHSPTLTIRVPAVCVAKEYFNSKNSVAFNRYNLFLRDLFQCQYCAEVFKPSELTIDHVIPKSKGGGTSWENCVAACKQCNWDKSNFLMKPLRQPFRPDYWYLANKRKSLDFTIKHPSWNMFLHRFESVAV